MSFYQLTLHDEDSHQWYHPSVLLGQARAIGFHGFVLFLPYSVAFSQICLSLFALTYIVEALLKKHFPIPWTPLNYPLLAYCAIRLISAMINSPSLSTGKKELEDFVGFAVFFLCYMYIQKVSQVKKLSGLLIFYVTLAASYGVLQHFWEVDVFRLARPISFLKHVNDDLTAPVRISGFLSYMTFSGHLAMTIPIIYLLLFSVKSLYKKGLLAISLFLTSLALLWTYTRSAWIATVCAFTLFGYLKGKKTFIILLLLGIFLVSLTIIQPDFFDRSLIDRSLSVFSAKENLERMYTWESTLYMIHNHPLTGIGKGNYSELAREYRQKMYPGFEFSSYAHAHNNILQVAVTAGIPALLCFLWLWGVLFKEMYRTYRQIPQESSVLKHLSLGFLGAIIAFFIQGFFEHNFGDIESAMMLWFIVALALKLQHLTSAQR
jgi:O-antigen ligase